MLYSQILPYLIIKGCVTPKALKPMIPPYPPNFDENNICDYHSRSPGHTTENGKALKYKVQDLIDAKLPTFKELGPNGKNNHCSDTLVQLSIQLESLLKFGQ